MLVEQWAGLGVTILGGLLAGTSAWPAKCISRLRPEHWMLISSGTGLLIFPWLFTITLCPNALSVYASLPAEIWIKGLGFSTAWGIANLLCMLCWRHIGVALTVGLLTGIGLPIGVLTPMLLKTSGRFSDSPDINSTPGRIILVAVILMITGVIMAARAGYRRSQGDTHSRAGFITGLVMASLAGVLQVGLAFSFTYTQEPIINAIKQQGASEVGANLAVWALCLIGGGLVNIAYPLMLMLRNKNWRVMATHPGEVGLALIMGLTFIAFILAMGSGMRLLGALGASVGFGVFQSLQLSGAQMLGLVTGEWRSAPKSALRQLYMAIAILLIGVLMMGYAGSLK